MNATIPVSLEQYKRLLHREQKYLKMVGELASESRIVDFICEGCEINHDKYGKYYVQDRGDLNLLIDDIEEKEADQEREAQDRFSACQNNPALRESHRQEETR